MSKAGDARSNERPSATDVAMADSATSPPPRSPELSEPLPVPMPSDDDPGKESNPFTDRDPRMLAYAWVGFVLRVMLMVGAIFSVIQYLQAREEKRVERTLELVDMWDRPEFQEAQRALRTRLIALNQANQALLGSNPSENDRKIYFSSIGKQLMTEEGGTMPLAEFEPHFDRVVYFLNRVGSCVKGNLCDREVADEYFLDYARSFWSYFSDYAVDQRRMSPNFAKAIEHYVATAPAEAEQ
jgi:hypothetical protein